MSVPVAPSRWPFLGHTPALLRQRFAFTDSLPAHGEIVKLYVGPAPVYFVASPRLAHEVLVNEGPKFRKGAMFDKFRPFVGNGLVLSNGDFHLRQRRLMQPAFHRDRLAAYAEIMRRAAADLSDSWRAGEVRPIDDDMQSLAVTIVGEALFSTELGKAAIAEARRSIYVIIQQGMIRALSPKFVEKLPVPGNRRFDEAIARMRGIVVEVIRDWRRAGTDHGDLLSTLLLAGMTDEQARDEALTLLTAGIETTALALAWTFHELGRHPEIEARVHAELDEVLGGRPVTIEDLPRLTYTRQVVDEVLRQYPLWMLMRRTLTEVDLGGTRLPEGAEVIVSPHALHHDPTSFADPDRFDPDRWTPERAAAVPKGAFVPFGAGTRQCIGNRFAQNEIVITLATVAARWRLVPVPGKPVRVKFTSAAYPESLPMTVVPR
ncbi:MULTISPECIES: cytochrome P450 [unclassified Amycolatopsis]|uniref:cytochrome P450 n=1 Tax=unclassified Amycolatopsis TaxID=2618356 RepID=UPI0028751920|nr:MULTISPECIES: cytochrome P450 [unclassified Amycolatopsis]MDS0137676.1 cytochrome P450 [Amycolatopsis sp. 505]MDS0141871.1 cytochrome P450 [Amycolatopsis sp. CM201R]